MTDPDHDDAVKQAIVNALPDTPVNIQDWRQNNDSFLAAVTVEGNVMFLILTLIIIVAAFNVISSLIMMVKDKARDIAILRTMGASSGAILRIFLMCGASVGILGTLIGFGLGVVFCAYIEQIKTFVQTLTGTPLFDPDRLLPGIPARETRLASGDRGPADVLRALDPRNPLPELARRPHRPDRGPPQ